LNNSGIFFILQNKIFLKIQYFPSQNFVTSRKKEEEEEEKKKKKNQHF
jgi:hypothetical protein